VLFFYPKAATPGCTKEVGHKQGAQQLRNSMVNVCVTSCPPDFPPDELTGGVTCPAVAGLQVQG
jgi:hypothetical protein